MTKEQIYKSLQQSIGNKTPIELAKFLTDKNDKEVIKRLILDLYSLFSECVESRDNANKILSEQKDILHKSVFKLYRFLEICDYA